MKNKKSNVTTRRILIITVICLLIITGSLLFAGCRYSNSPEPEVTYGEFQFMLEYEVDGQITTINDAYVCEYVGTHWNWNQGEYREWKGYLKSNQKEDIVLITDGNKEIICTIGSPKYYMGDIDDSLITKTTEPKLILLEHYANGVSSSILSDELKEYYKINLISWKLSDPIVNNFQ